MGTRIFVGGLPFSTDEARVRALFEPHGTVESVHIVTDKFTGRSRGFGFVEMASTDEASAAIAALNGTELDGRTLTVNEARPQEHSGGGRSGPRRGPSRRDSMGGQGRGRW
jgi:RNA recognition motif-containing protein